MRTSIMTAAVLAAALGACTPLTANAPLFTPADSAGPAPFMEGTWVALDGDKCTRAMATRRGGPPAACKPFQIRHLPDGAWEISGPDSDRSPPHMMTLRFVIAPAVATAGPDAYAPLYVGEYLGDPGSEQKSDESNAPHYAAIAPIGAMPAHEVYLDGQIDCTAILREGPLQGVSERHGSDGSLSGCVAADQAAVRAAAQRAIIESLGHIDDERLIFVRP